MPPLEFDYDDERPTSGGSSRLRSVQSVVTAPPPAGSSEPKSNEELIGEMMAAVAANTSSVTNLAEQVNLFGRELGAHIRAADTRTDEVKAAAKHGSNRLALLFGALVTLYELTAPYLHDIAKVLHQ